jgi:hypothetical protein
LDPGIHRLVNVGPRRSEVRQEWGRNVDEAWTDQSTPTFEIEIADTMLNGRTINATRSVPQQENLDARIRRD